MRHILARNCAGLLAQAAARKILVAFDFDGTLAPIVAARDEAAMRPRTGELLRAMCARYACAVISGRSRPDVAARLAGAPVKYIVGNHGLEPGSLVLERVAAEMEAIRRQLEATLGGTEGIEIEDKQYSLAIHYRRSRRKLRARAAIRAATAGIPEPVRLVGGELVMNVLPAGAPHKGDALLALRAAEGADCTDEDVFALDQPGRLLAVRVGRSKTSSAPFFVRHQGEVDMLLEALVQSQRGSAP